MSATKTLRYAGVTGARDAEQVARYLPENYEVYGHRFPEGPSGPIVVLIRGYDDCGWTMGDYVIPRLASGLLWATEVARPAQEVLVHLNVSVTGEMDDDNTIMQEVLTAIDAIRIDGVESIDVTLVEEAS
jgi:hypothetical protein